MDITPSQAAFINWMRANHASILNEAVRRSAKQGLSGLGADATTTATTTSPSWFQSLTDTIKSVAQSAAQILPVVQQAKTSQSLINTNIQRAQQGLPPITAAQVTSPALTAAVGVSPSLQYIMWGGLGLVAFFLISRVLKK